MNVREALKGGLRASGTRRVPLRRRFLLVALPPAALLLATSAFVYGILDQSIRATQDVVRLRNGIIEMNLLLRLIVDEETSVRGYVIAGDPSYLAPYEASAAELDQVVARIRTGIAEDQTGLAMLDRIVAIHDEWTRRVAEHEISLARAGRRDAAAAFVASGVGKSLIDDLRAETEGLIDRSWAELELRRAVRDETSLAAQQAVLAGPILAAVLAVLSIVVVSRRVVREIDEVAEVATSMQAGNLDRRSEVRSADEVGDLARAFNGMADRIEALIGAERETSRQLREQASALEEANTELQTFSYSVSHDLRTPLRTIDGFSAILLEDHSEQLDDEARRLLGRVRAASQRMGELIDDLLELSRVSRTPLERRSVDVSALAAEVLAVHRQDAPERVVDVTIQPGLVAHADPGLARVVLDNLLGNAWKFTARQPSARISLDAPAPGVFRVRDDGAGFDEAYADKLFQPFQRLHHANEFPGSGIGLATVQRALRRHGGAIRAQGGTGTGATFWFSFERPIRQEDTHAG